jgi:rRNA maturation RNase YbeY
MITVLVKKQTNYAVSTPKIKKTLRDYFTAKGIVSEAEVSVFIVGEEKILELGKKYLKDKRLHSVLSFTNEESKPKFIYPPGTIYLGEIIVCYPEAVREAGREGKLIDGKIKELIEHSADHLLGIHHE